MNTQEENVFARFYDKVVKTDSFKENNMPIFEEKTYIEIRITDDNDIVDRIAEDSDKERFPAEYQHYVNSKKIKQEGTPLNQYSFLTAIQLENCRYCNIETVEQLASISDDKAKIFDLFDEKMAANQFLENAKSFSEKELKFKEQIEELKAENEKLRDEIEALKNTNKDFNK